MAEIPLNFETVDQRQQWMRDNAAYYTTVVFRGAGWYEKAEQNHIRLAEAQAERWANEYTKAVMIYAVVPPYDSLVEVVYPEGQHASSYKSGDQAKSDRSRTSASKNK